MVVERISAGIIPIYNPSDPKYLLLKYPQGHWGFPKGHVESNESLPETAARELAEETGLTSVDRIGDFRESIEYWYRFNGSKHHKIVYFFAGEVDTQSVTLSEEHVDYEWNTTRATLNKITYDNERSLFEEWLEYRDRR